MTATTEVKPARALFMRTMAQALFTDALHANDPIPFEDAWRSGVEWCERTFRTYFEKRAERLHAEGKHTEASQVAIVAVECAGFIVDEMARDFEKIRVGESPDEHKA